jgi:hypothetical protein
VVNLSDSILESRPVVDNSQMNPGNLEKIKDFIAFFLSLLLICLIVPESTPAWHLILLGLCYSIGALLAITKRLKDQTKLKFILFFLIMILVLNLKIQDDVISIHLILIFFAYFISNLAAKLLVILISKFLNFLLTRILLEGDKNFLNKIITLLSSPPLLLGAFIYLLANIEIIPTAKSNSNYILNVSLTISIMIKNSISKIINEINQILPSMPDFGKYVPPQLTELSNELQKVIEYFYIEYLRLYSFDFPKIMSIILLFILLIISLYISNKIKVLIESYLTVYKDLPHKNLYLDILYLIFIFYLIYYINIYGISMNREYPFYVFIFIIIYILYLINYISSYIDEEINIKLSDIVLAVDCSESMIYYDKDQYKRKEILINIIEFISKVQRIDRSSRFNLAKLKHAKFFGRIRLIFDRKLKYASLNENVGKIMAGILFYSDKAHTDNYSYPLTRNMMDLLCFVEKEFPDDTIPETNLNYAIESAISMLERSQRSINKDVFRSIFVITDEIRDGNADEYNLRKFIDWFNMFNGHIFIITLNPHPPHTKYELDILNNRLNYIYYYDIHNDSELLFSDILFENKH